MSATGSSPPSPVSKEKEEEHRGEGSSLDVIEYDNDCDVIDFTNIRMREVPDLSLCHRLHSLTLRCNFLTRVDHLHQLTALTDLDLYENHITDLDQCTFPPTLTSLDLSFNRIRVIKNLDNLPNLTSLFLANNKISEIQGLTHLPNLRLLELGANRLRSLPPPPSLPLPQLHSLFLGRNKLTQLPDLSYLTSLRLLSVQSNRLTRLEEDGIGRCVGLEELYVSHNGVGGGGGGGGGGGEGEAVGGEGRGEGLRGLRGLKGLRVLDVTRNGLEGAEGVEDMAGLEEVWLGENAIRDWGRLEALRGKARLSCIYLEGNPVAKDAEYERRVQDLAPQLKQLDANELPQQPQQQAAA